MLLRYGALVALILIWGTTWAVIRVGLEGIPPFNGVALRFAIAAAVLYLTARVAGVDLRDGGPRLRRLWVINTLFSFAIPYCVVYWAEQWVPSGLAALLFATYPLFVAILAHYRLPAERLRWTSGIGILIGFLGVAAIYSEDLTELGGGPVRLAAAVYLLAPAAAAISSVEVKRSGEGLSAMALTAPPMAFTALVVAPLALAESGPLRLDGQALWALFYLSLVGSAIAFGLYFWLLARLPATRLAMITYATPIVALVVGVALMGERLTLRICLGSILVLGGVAVALQSAGRKGESGSCRDAT